MQNYSSKLALALVLLAFVPLIASLSADFSTCGRRNRGFGTADVHDVRITPCTNKRRCTLKKNTNVKIEIDFTPTVASSQAVTANAAWALGSTQLPLPNMDRNACDKSICPYTPGVLQTYTYNLTVSNGYPVRNYNVKWTLNGSPFNVCIYFPIKISN